jgi:succinate dehydrogenase subunit D
MTRIDRRAHGHAAYWAFVVHRVSGVALAAFLPLHFWALGQALAGADALDRFVVLTDAPLVKLSEWALVMLLSAHLAGGLRVLAIELGPWSGLRKSWIAYGAAFAVSAGLAFALALVG